MGLLDVTMRNTQGKCARRSARGMPRSSFAEAGVCASERSPRHRFRLCPPSAFLELRIGFPLPLAQRGKSWHDRQTHNSLPRLAPAATPHSSNPSRRVRFRRARLNGLDVDLSCRSLAPLLSLGSSSSRFFLSVPFVLCVPSKERCRLSPSSLVCLPSLADTSPSHAQELRLTTNSPQSLLQTTSTA